MSNKNSLSKEERIIRDRLKILDEEIQFLESLEIELEEFAKDKKTSHAVLYSLIVGIESIADIGNHILSYYFGEKPDSYKDILKELANLQVVSKDLVDKSIKMPDFRNLAIHVYHRVDEKKVYDYIPEAANQFKEYSKAFLRFIENDN